jgi:transposase
VLALVVRCKNQIRGVLREHDIASPRWLWSKKPLAWLESLELHPVAKLRLELAVEEFKSLREKIKRIERELQKYADRTPAVKLLMTIPGVGIRTAEALVAYIDQPDRFRHTKAIGNYFGVVPCQDASAGKNHLGHITHDGPATVRRLLTQAAWQGIRRSAVIRAYFERVQHGDPDRKKIALVATMHYLARVALAMLRTGEAWRTEEPEVQENNEKPGTLLPPVA